MSQEQKFLCGFVLSYRRIQGGPPGTRNVDSSRREELSVHTSPHEGSERAQQHVQHVLFSVRFSPSHSDGRASVDPSITRDATTTRKALRHKHDRDRKYPHPRTNLHVWA